MTSIAYPPPLDQLLTYGDCSKMKKALPNYVEELQLKPAHIPDLIRMATDEALLWAETDSLEVWAPVHAWRSLGQLRAEEAIDPLILLFHELDEDDWAPTELPRVFGMIGAAAIPALKAYLADSSHSYYARNNAATALEAIGIAHPEVRLECVEAIAEELGNFIKNSPTLNGFLIANLLDLNAVEAALVMEQAFAAKRVDLSIAGDWNDVQVTLGLKTRREVQQEIRQQNASLQNLFRHTSSKKSKSSGSGGFASPASQNQAAKKKRK